MERWSPSFWLTWAACMTHRAASSTRAVPRSFIEELQETIMELMAMSVGDEGSGSSLMVLFLSFCRFSNSHMSLGACIPSAGSQELCAAK